MNTNLFFQKINTYGMLGPEAEQAWLKLLQEISLRNDSAKVRYDEFLKKYPGQKGRAYAKFHSMQEVKKHKANLQKIVKRLDKAHE